MPLFGCHSFGELKAREAGVKAAFGDEAVMGAAGNDAAFVEDEDGAVTVRDRDTMTQERVPMEGVKRLILDNGYFETYNRDNVSLIDLRDVGVSGADAEARCDSAGIVLNKNAIPFDPAPPSVASGRCAASRAPRATASSTQAL